MKVVYRNFNGSEDWAWANSHVGLLRVEDTSGIMAINEDNGETVGACIFDNWTQNSVQTHFIISTPLVLRHGFDLVCYDFIFEECGKKYMYGLVPGDNSKAIKFNEHQGWTIKTILPEAFADGIDYLLMQITREDWEKKHGQ